MEGLKGDKKQVCYYEISFTWDHSKVMRVGVVMFCCNMQLVSEKTRNESVRAVMSSSRPGSSGELSENRSSKLFSSGSQKIQPGQESKPAARLGRDDALRSFDLLTIGSGKRKWVTKVPFERKESLSLCICYSVYIICSYNICEVVYM